MTRYRRVRGPRLRGDGSGPGGMGGPPILAVALTARVAVILLASRPPRPRRQPTFVFRRQPVASLPEICAHGRAVEGGDGGHEGNNPTPPRAYPLPNRHCDDGQGEPEIVATMGDHATVLLHAADRYPPESAITPLSDPDEVPRA